MPSLKNAEINEALKENENKMTLKFNTILILIKYIELVVRNANSTWKNIYHLHKPSVEVVEIKDDEDDEEEKGEEEDLTETTQFDSVDVEEDVEEEATEEGKQDDEAENIAIVGIASLPHSPAIIAISSIETALASLIVTTPSDTSNFQSLLTHS